MDKCKELFYEVKVDAGGYGVSWNDELDLAADDIWENGTLVGVDETLELEVILAGRITKAREKSGITQKELSKRTGIYQADISKIERGLANPSLSTLKRIAKGLGMELKIIIE